MKRVAVLVLSLFVLSAQGFAAEGPDAARHAHREKMKVIKQAQREARKNAPKQPQGNANGFWSKEGERSGLNRMKPSGEFLKNLNPMPFFKSQDEQYKARKAQSQGK